MRISFRALIFFGLLVLGLLQPGCSGGTVSVGVAVGVAGPYYGYPGPMAPPIYVGRPYRGYW